MHLFGIELHRNLNCEITLSNLPTDPFLICFCAPYKVINIWMLFYVPVLCFPTSWSVGFPGDIQALKAMSRWRLLLKVNLPIQYPVCPSASVMMGWLPSAPTQLQHVHVLQDNAGHRHSPSLLLTADPCQPRLASRRPRSPAANLCSRSSPPLTALVRRPRSPPSLVAPAAHHRQCSPSQLAAARLDAQACHPCLHYPPVVPVARAENLPQRPASTPCSVASCWIIRRSPLVAALQARRPCPPGAPASHSPLHISKLGGWVIGSNGFIIPHCSSSQWEVMKKTM